MKTTMRIFLVLLIAACSCKSSKDILAVYNGGEIERGELREWMEARNINPAALRKDPGMQKKLLGQIALEKIVYGLVSASGYADDPEFIIVRESVYRNFLASYYYSRHFRNISFSEKAADVSIIRLYVKGGMRGAEYDKKISLIRDEILPALKNGAQFSDLAKKYSEDSAKKRGGSLGFTVTGMLEKEMAVAVASIPDGGFTVEPVVIGNSLCIIRVNRRIDITDGNISAVIADKPNRDRILAFIRRREMASAEERLKAGGNVVSSLDRSTFRSDSEVLFTINGREYTTAYIKSILRVFYILKNNEVVTEYKPDEIKFTAGRVMAEILASSEAEKLGYQNDREFAGRWKYIERAALTGMYKGRYLVDHISITDAEIDDLYKTQLLSQKKRKSAGKPVTRPAVRSQLYRAKFKKIKEEWEAGLLREHNYQIR